MTVNRQEGFCEEFHLPKYNKQVMVDLNLFSGVNVLVSGQSLKNVICGQTPFSTPHLVDSCNGQMSCSLYEGVLGKLTHRSEQCSDNIYVLIF